MEKAVLQLEVAFASGMTQRRNCGPAFQWN